MATQSPIRLTEQVKAGGCASKLAPGSLRSVLSRLPQQHDDNLLVGFETSDDAGIYKLTDETALVQTVDFFTPMVDDPFTFGQIAAANALSDVYAMGGTPRTALALVCFPQTGDLAILEQIMRGGLSKMTEAGCVIAGGHSVRDAEMKFGYSVTGTVHPARFFTNTGARVGDALLLTKPIGTGVITTALKQGKAEQSWIESAVDSMTRLNRAACGLATSDYDVHAITDITGFGLMGHVREVAFGSGVQIQIETARVPLLHGARDAVRTGAIPAGLIANREFADCVVADMSGANIDAEVRTLLYDPQTSGGLLLSVEQKDAKPLLKRLLAEGLQAAVIGSVTAPYNAQAGGPAILLA